MLPLLTVFLMIETPNVIINPMFHCLSSSSINIHCWHDIGIGEQSWPSGGLGRGLISDFFHSVSCQCFLPLSPLLSLVPGCITS